MEMGKNRLKGREFTEFLLRKSTRLSVVYTMSNSIFFSLLSFPIHSNNLILFYFLSSSFSIHLYHYHSSLRYHCLLPAEFQGSPASRGPPSHSFSTLQPEGSFQNTNLIIIHVFKNPSVAPNLYLRLWGYACVLVSNPEPLVLWASTYLPSFGT